MEPTDKLKVMATTGIIEDMVKEIGQNEVAVISLIQGDLDPHSYQLVKGDQEKLTESAIIFANGLGLEHGPSLKAYLENSSKTVFLGDEIAKEKPDDILRYKGQTDPHIWMDISLWKLAIPHVVKALSKARPDQKELFEKRGQKLFSDYEKADQEIKVFISTIPPNKRYLVTSHDAFNYFARAYLADEKEREAGQWEVRFQAPEGLAPDSQLSLNDIRFIVNHLKKYGIEVIFPESNLSPDSLKKIIDAAKEEGIQVKLGNPYLYGDAMGPKGSDGDTYLKMLWHNAKTIKEDMEGL